MFSKKQAHGGNFCYVELGVMRSIMRTRPGGDVLSRRRGSFIRSGAAVALSVLLGLGFCAQPSRAQGYYGSAYGITSTLLWPLRAAYPLLYLPYGGYRNPSYLTRVLIQQGTRAAMRTPPVKINNPTAGADAYSDIGAVGGQQQQSRKMQPFRYGQVGVDQIVSRYGKPEDQADQAILNRMPGMDGAPQMVPQAATPGTLTPQYVPQSFPQQVARPSSPQLLQPPLPPAAPANVVAPNPEQSASATFPGHAPLANGFVETVNSQFNGDISKALFNPETRAWARAVGVVSHDDVFDADLSSDRIDVIKKILKDENLDAVSKIDAVRILLRNNQGRPSKKRH